MKDLDGKGTFPQERPCLPTPDGFQAREKPKRLASATLILLLLAWASAKERDRSLTRCRLPPSVPDARARRLAARGRRELDGRFTTTAMEFDDGGAG